MNRSWREGLRTVSRLCLFPSLPSVVGCSGNPHERELLSSMQKKMVIAEDGELERCMVPGTVGVSNHLCSDYYTREKIFLCSSNRRHQECEWWLCVAFLNCVLKRPPSLRCLCAIVTEIAAALNSEMEAPPWGCQNTTASWAASLWDSYVSKKQTCHILELGNVQNLLATASQILRKWCIFCYSPVKLEVLN